VSFPGPPASASSAPPRMMILAICSAMVRYFNSIKFVKDFEKKTLPDFFYNYSTQNIDAISELCTEMALRIALDTSKVSNVDFDYACGVFNHVSRCSNCRA
jgi:hypothetical protein